MSEERKRVLKMLADGKITADEAEQLLEAMGGPARAATAVMDAPVTNPKYLRVTVESPEGKEGKGPEKVNVRVPIQLLRAGMKFAALIPKDAQAKIDDAMHEKGMQFNLADMTPEMMEDLIANIGELTVDVSDGEGSQVRVFCE